MSEIVARKSRPAHEASATAPLYPLCRWNHPCDILLMRRTKLIPQASFPSLVGPIAIFRFVSMTILGSTMAANSCEASLGECEGDLIKWQVRPMRREDIPKCLEIWLQVELCEGEQTVASALSSDPGGFYVAELIPTREVIGMCAGVLVSPDTAFMGFYAVEPKYQGIGVGRELWATTTKRLHESTNIGLYGVPAMSDKYKKSGFKLEDEIRMIIFESKRCQDLNTELLFDFDNLKIDNGNDILELQVIDSRTEKSTFQKLIEYDWGINKFSREKLLGNYLVNDTDELLTLALIRKSRSQSSECCHAETASKHSSSCACDDAKLSRRMSDSLSLSSTKQTGTPKAEYGFDLEILGYGCTRLDNTGGAMVGPIYADSREVCEVIMKDLLTRFQVPENGKYSIMSLTSNNQASEILERIGLQEMDQCSRMFTKFVPEASFDRIFYVHSPNFSLF